MQLKVSKINPEIAHLIHRADSYINADGKNPVVGSIIPAHEVAIDKKATWGLSVGDVKLLKLLEGQIYVFQLNNELIYITE